MLWPVYGYNVDNQVPEIHSIIYIFISIASKGPSILNIGVDRQVSLY